MYIHTYHVDRFLAKDMFRYRKIDYNVRKDLFYVLVAKVPYFRPIVSRFGAFRTVGDHLDHCLMR